MPSAAYVTDPAGQLAVLSGVAAGCFWIERRTQWALFRYVPPLAFIYLVPVLLSNVALPGGVTLLPTASPTYDALSSLALPALIVLLLLNVNVARAARVMGRGIGVMLCGSLGVVVGAPLGLLAVRGWLQPDAWKAYGALSGSWIGGTANMAAVGEMVGASGTEMGLAVLADTTIYLVWLPVLLASKRFDRRFARFSGADAERLAQLRAAAATEVSTATTPSTPDYLALLALAFGAAWGADALAGRLPVREPYLSVSTWRILGVTTLGIALSLTPARRLPGSQTLAMALLYLFVARMGASAAIDRAASQAIPFLFGALICIFVHGAFCLCGARLFKVDVHTAAIASAANVGGAASAPIVAMHHEPTLAPASILMALVGYAVGNYAGYVAALLCRAVSGAAG